MRKKLALLLLLSLLLGLFAGCGDTDLLGITVFHRGEEDQPAEEEPQDEEESHEMASETVLTGTEDLEVFRLAYQPEYGLNPFTTVSLNNRSIFSLLYEPLYLVNSQFEAEPVLAAGTTVSQDGLTTTITLQRGVKFHNGAGLTAQDVVYSYEQAKASNYYGNRFVHITAVTAVNDFMVQVVTDTSFESVAVLLDFPIIRKDTVGDPVPDGTGPFAYTGSAKLEKFDQWWQPEWLLGFDQVELTNCTTSTDIRDNFEYGLVNLVCTDPNSAAYGSYHNDNELWSCATTLMQYVGFNTNKRAFSNPDVRSAITFAIDRDEIVAQDLGGFAVAASLPASPLWDGYDSGLAADYILNPEEFQARLDDAQVQDYTQDGILDVYYKGLPYPLEGDMIVSASSPQRVRTAGRIADSLNALGFDITVKALDDKDFAKALLYGNFDLYYGEVRLSANFDLGAFFRLGGSLAFGGLDSGTTLSLCASMLENRGNAYDLHKRVMEQGYLCPILFKSYAVYTTRGAASDLDPALDWVIH